MWDIWIVWNLINLGFLKYIVSVKLFEKYYEIQLLMNRVYLNMNNVVMYIQ